MTEKAPQKLRTAAFDPSPFRNPNGALRILLVYKKSRLETFGPKNEFDERDLIEEHAEHSACLNKVRNHLSSQDYDVLEIFRTDITKAKCLNRIIVTVGGDGTILDASHYSTTSPIFGINSDPKRSVGSLCIGRVDTFETLLKSISSSTLDLLHVARIGGTLDGEPLPIVPLNEVLVAHKNPAALSRYQIQVGDVSEVQRSSGVWIAAPMGSTGATLSAGGKVGPLDDDRIQILVREPYFSFGQVNRIFSGFVCQDQEIKITSKMMDGCIFFDGPHKSRKFPVGSVLTLHSHGSPLPIFVNADLERRRTQIATLRDSFHEKMLHNSSEFVC